MALDLHVSMNDAALAPFRAAWESARERSAALADRGLIASARRHYDEVTHGSIAPFLRAHLDAFAEVIRFLDDGGWTVAPPLRRDLQGALAYFIDSTDLIPDDNQPFGLLDDAIVLELALAAHRHEWAAWREFDRFRRDYPQFAGMDRDEWMNLREEELRLALRHRQRSQRFDRRSYVVDSPLAPFAVH